MKSLLSAILFGMAFSMAAQAAGPTASITTPELQIKIYRDEPCELDVLQKQLMKKADVRYKGKDFKACYAELQGGYVHIVDESGDEGLIPSEAFTVDKSSI